MDNIETRAQHLLLDPAAMVLPETDLVFPGTEDYDFHHLFIPAGNRQFCLMLDRRGVRDPRRIITELQVVGHNYLPGIYVSPKLPQWKAIRMKRTSIPFFDLDGVEHLGATGVVPTAARQLSPTAQKIVLAKLRHQLVEPLTPTSGRAQFACCFNAFNQAMVDLEALGAIVREYAYHRMHVVWLLKGEPLWRLAAPHMSLPPPSMLHPHIPDNFPEGIDPLDAFLVFQHSTNAEIQKRIKRGVNGFKW